MSAKPTSLDNGFGLADLLNLGKEVTVRVAWAKIAGSVRAAGREIIKDPRALAKVLREAADALDKYAAGQKGGEGGRP